MSAAITSGGFALHAQNAITAIEREGIEIAKWDLEGRPVSAQAEGVYYRRGISGEVMARGRLERAGRVLPEADRRSVLARLRALAADAEKALRLAPAAPTESIELEKRLEKILSIGIETLEAERGKFLTVYRPVPILPPDRVLSFVVQLTEGCPWNRCSFCGLYPDRDFRVRGPDELAEHVRRALALFGRAAILRKSIYIGDGDPFTLPDGRILPLIDRILETFREEEARGTALPSPRDLYSFARLHSLRGRTAGSFAAFRARGFRRLYIGVETGNPDLYRILKKPGDLRDLPPVVQELRRAGLAVGLIFLVGVGGARFRAAHREASAQLVASLPLGPDDLVYLSPFRLVEESEYARWAAEEGIEPLERPAIGGEAAEMVRRMRVLGSRAKASYYPLEHFVY
ncbi:MAG: radical SAM protein [Candidatus Latescibacterota bacterium]|nr:MAG: radical SAM protein [Candidatus Latescibacterota bacterium]